MTGQDWLTQRFEEQRSRLEAVAYRMLGSRSDADDAVQEAWLRLSRTDPDSVGNLGGWLTTVVGRVCLDMLRSRAAHREQPLDDHVRQAPASGPGEGDPEEEALMAESVGLALLVVLDTLTPAERLALVLHDMFTVPFGEIAPILGRSPNAAKQLASRARRRLQAPGAAPGADTARQAGALAEIRGAHAVASQFAERAVQTLPALAAGTPGIVWAITPGTPRAAFGFTISRGKIAHIDLVFDPLQLRQLELAISDR